MKELAVRSKSRFVAVAFELWEKIPRSSNIRFITVSKEIGKKGGIFVPIRKAKKVVKNVVTAVKKKAREISCRHPKGKIGFYHDHKANAIVGVCTVCGKERGRVVFPKRRKPDLEEQALIAILKERPPHKFARKKKH